MTAKIDPTIDVVEHVLVSNWTKGGTITIPYPAARSAATYQNGTLHNVQSATYMPFDAASRRLGVTFGPTQITLTNNSGQILTAGTRLFITLDRAGAEFAGDGLANPAQMAELKTVLIDLGTPIASDSDGIVASQAATAANGLATGINGALAASGTAVLDVPRNVVAAWTGTAVLTVTGEDQYGKPMRESSASGTSFTGKKAFKRVTGVTVSADVTGLTVGTSKVLGRPVFVAGGNLVREFDDGSGVTNGTFVAGDGAAATATTGDVRGTYSPNANPNGTKRWQLVATVTSASFTGQPQFAG